MRSDGHTTVLVVENNLDVAVSVALTLQEAGHRVLQAFDGHQGLHLARDARPDLVLLAARLPRMDGFDLCRELHHESQALLLLLVERELEGLRALELTRQVGDAMRVADETLPQPTDGLTDGT